MTIEQDDVIKIIKMMDESDYDEMHLEMGDLKLSISKSGTLGPFSEVPPTPQAPSAPIQRKQTQPTSPSPETEPVIVTQHPEVVEDAAIDEEGLIAIKSPLLGNFYRSAKPESPPFVKVGNQIKSDDTVCLIEVMKTFTTVKAGVEGRIVKICADNGEMVEYQQILFLVEPI